MYPKSVRESFNATAGRWADEAEVVIVPEGEDNLEWRYLTLDGVRVYSDTWADAYDGVDGWWSMSPTEEMKAAIRELKGAL